MVKLTNERASKQGGQLPEQSHMTEGPSSSLAALSLNGTRAKATPYGHPLGPHILAPAGSEQAEATGNMEAGSRGLDNARDTSTAEELTRRSPEAGALSGSITHEVHFCMCKSPESC